VYNEKTAAIFQGSTYTKKDTYNLSWCNTSADFNARVFLK